MSNPLLAAAIDRLLEGTDIGRDGAAEALHEIMSGDVDQPQAAGFLVALRAKGETPEELAGLVSVVREKSVAVQAPAGVVVDTCGTGGGISTFNVSTAAAFVVAGDGVVVAKHGNRSATSKCGSADVLEALGASIDLVPEAVAECMAETGVGFMFAPMHHPAFAYIAPVRKSLGVHTVFNRIGPLANPADPGRQVIGVASQAHMRGMAEALRVLGTTRAMVVRGRDGMDELSTTAVNDAVRLVDGAIAEITLDPAELGIDPPAAGALAGGDPLHNAKVIHDLLATGVGPAADIVALNAGAALWAAGVVDDVAAGLALARERLTSGAANERLAHFVAVTTRLAA
ncbi:MAG: anthranilate phosphoribosyltransferase [Thermoleophilia bacterium]